MKSSLSLALCFVAILFFAGLALGQEVLFQSDFGSDDGFVVLPSSRDSEFEFNYNYSDFDGIPEAPNSDLTGGDSQRGLKLEANIVDGAISAIVVATDGLALTGQYAVQVDVWLNFNFPAGAAGTTEFGGLAVGHDAETPGLAGAALLYDTDGDTASDYRLYKDSIFQTLETGQMPVDSLNNLDEPFAEAFPSVDIEAVVPAQAVVGITNPGSGGFRWMTLEALVDTEAIGSGVADDRGVATFSLTDAASQTKIEIGTVDNSNGDGVVNMGGEVAVIFTDIFTSVSNDPSLSFGLFDNLIVSSVETSVDPLDCTGDGFVNSSDVECATAETIAATLEALGFLAGDLDLNGKVEFADFLNLADNFGDDSKGGVYANGDVDLNGQVAFADFLSLANNFGATVNAAAAVPEPSGFLLVCLGGLLVSRLRRR